jgi:hypothetical protein
MAEPLGRDFGLSYLFITSGCRFHPRSPLAFDRCRVDEPPQFEVGAGRQAACWPAEGRRELPPFPTRPRMATLPILAAPVVASAAAAATEPVPAP